MGDIDRALIIKIQKLILNYLLTNKLKTRGRICLML